MFGNGIERKKRTTRKVTHTVRTADGGTKTFNNYAKALAIKCMCVECMGFEGDPRTECTSPRCPLFPFRRYGRMTARGDEKKSNDKSVDNVK